MSGCSRIKNLHPNESSSSSSSSSSDCFLSSSQTKHKNNQQSQEFETREPHSEMKNGDTYKESRSGSGAAKFRRNASVSSSSSSSSSSSAVKRAFSIRRSSSVSERYCRIRDQRVALSSPLDDEEFDQSFNKGKKSGHKRIFKSCKRIFGL